MSLSWPWPKVTTDVIVHATSVTGLSRYSNQWSVTTVCSRALIGLSLALSLSSSSHAPYMSCTRTHLFISCCSSCLHCMPLVFTSAAAGHPGVPGTIVFRDHGPCSLARPLAKAMSKTVSTRCLIHECRSDTMSASINGPSVGLRIEL